MKNALILTAVIIMSAGETELCNAQSYTVTNLGTLGGRSSQAWSVNNAGTVVGQSDTVSGDRFHAFAYIESMADLGSLGSLPQSLAFALNDNNLAVGVAYSLGNLDERAAAWDLSAAGSTPVDLGAFLPRAVNANGVVAGMERFAAGELGTVPRAVRWTGGPLQPLGTLGGLSSEAHGINSLGWIVGQSPHADGLPPHAFAWIGGAMHDLGTLGGDYGVAYDVNDFGLVVGAARNAAGQMHGFVFSIDVSGNVLSRTDIGDLGGGYSAAYAVNAAGQAVGTSNDRAILWNEGLLADLNDLLPPGSGWVLTTARDVSDAGQIVGEGLYLGQAQAFLLSPSGACATAADCGDTDTNGIRDDNCMWVQCAAGSCNAVPITFADMGGAFGACEPDGFVNIFDRGQALTCFAATSPCDSLNADAGGAFGACAPDGFCNLFDANHALTTFAGTNSCTCPPGPAPPAVSEAVAKTSLTLRADRFAAPGERVAIAVHADNALADLQSYQLHLAVSGGERSSLELVDVQTSGRRDGAFGRNGPHFSAVNLKTGQMLAGLDYGGVATPPGAWLATFIYQLPKDARGTFVVDVLADAASGGQTFLVAGFTDPVAVTGSVPAVVQVRAPEQRKEGQRSQQR